MMTKNQRFRLIRKVFYKSRVRGGRLSPEMSDLLRELKEEFRELSPPDAVAEFRHEDMREEIENLDGYNRELKKVS